MCVFVCVCRVCVCVCVCVRARARARALSFPLLLTHTRTFVPKLIAMRINRITKVPTPQTRPAVVIRMVMSSSFFCMIDLYMYT